MYMVAHISTMNVLRAFSSTHQTLRGRVDGTQTEIRSEDLPYNLRLKPYVRFRASDLDVAARGLYLKRFEALVVRLQRFVAEPGADLANSLVLLGVRVIAREEKRAIDVCPLALAVVPTDHNKVERVADAREIILLELRERRQTGQ